MKFAKLSIAAIAVLGLVNGAVASENKITYKPFGSAKLYYETIGYDQGKAGVKDGSEDLFNKKGASGGALVSGGLTGKINSCFGYGFEGMAVDTLGLENNLVSGVRMGNGNGAPEDALDTQFWFPQAYLTYHPCDMGTNTTFKIGRQYLDTPLAFTERWNLAPNSFDAIVALNQDIINTTLVAAYVGRGNGVFGAVTKGKDFDEYGKEGAYALGVITNLLDGTLPIQLWGYDVVNVATAFWADAGYKLNLGDGMNFDLGAQYGYIDPDTDSNSYAAGLVGAAAAAGLDKTNGFGVKIGGGVDLDGVKLGLMAAYSSVDDDGTVSLANTATLKGTGGKKTKLYTAGIYTDGTGVAAPGSDAFKIKATTKLPGVGGLALQYVSCDNDDNNPMHNVDEIDAILSTGVLPGGLNTKLIYMNRSVDYATGKGLAQDTNHVRVILSKKF
jgi:hypothetical protein